MNSYIKSVAYYLPEHEISNKDLIVIKKEWTENKIFKKTGISKRFVAAPSETASDLAYSATLNLFDQVEIELNQIDALIFCTQSPDYHLPSTACILQNKLGLRNDLCAFDYNLGCSGYIYGLSIIKSLIESQQISNALLLTGNTYSKYIAADDASLMSIFSDAGSATLISNSLDNSQCISNAVYGTDGSGYKNLIVDSGGARNPNGDVKNLYMNGAEIFTFTMKSIPKLVQTTLDKFSLCMDDIDFFVFHQANAFMLNHLKKMINIPDEKFYMFIEDVGNTVSSSIPIAINNLIRDRKGEEMSKVMLVGFGVGYSWSANIVDLSHMV